MNKGIISCIVAMVFSMASVYMMFIDWGKGLLVVPVTISVAIAVTFHLLTIVLVREKEKDETKGEHET